MEHSVLSDMYRRNVVTSTRNGQKVVTKYTAATRCMNHLVLRYGADSVLRNGPRILRAMNTVRAEVEAQHAAS